MTGLATWGQAVQRIDAGVNVFGTPIDVFEAPFLGGVAIIEAPLLKPFTAVCLTSSEVRMRMKRNEFWNPRGVRGDAYEGDWIAEGAIELDNQSPPRLGRRDHGVLRHLSRHESRRWGNRSSVISASSGRLTSWGPILKACGRKPISRNEFSQSFVYLPNAESDTGCLSATMPSCGDVTLAGLCAKAVADGQPVHSAAIIARARVSRGSLRAAVRSGEMMPEKV